jgi:glycosyltransferase involved in cell wall biosynthesis
VNVLHVTAGKLYGGIETYLVTLARLRHLCPEMDPRFAVCFPGRLTDELAAAGVPVHDVGAVRLSRPWTVLRARRRLKQVIQEERIDVAITHGTWPHAVFAPTIRGTRARLVNFVHGLLTNPGRIDRWAARTPPDGVIANSHCTAATVARVFPGAAVQVCYLPVPSHAVENPEIVRRQVRAELNTPADDVVILQTSRLEECKGHSVLFDALTQLKDLPGWRLWIAGGPQQPEERERLSGLMAAGTRGGIASRVHYLGERSDVPRLMAAADIYCQPNVTAESFGLALVEALNAGLPVVTSDLGGAREIVTKECGVLCPPGNALAVAALLRALIADPARRRALGSAGPARGRELCEAERQIRGLDAALRSLIGTMALC